jgi:predicted phosphoribosyltransferase
MIHIIARRGRPFLNRQEAGKLLAKELMYLKRDTSNLIILGIPRGGVVVAHIVAQELRVPFDIVLASKLSAPYQSELAIGAIAENGHFVLNERLCSMLQIDDSYIEAEKRNKINKLMEKRYKYRAVKERIPLTAKTVVVIDDGIATGSSMQAALSLIQQENPALLMAAIPVGPSDSIHRLEPLADEIICLLVPEFFNAVGEFYLNFEQTTDEEVIDLLHEHNA